MLLEGTSVCLGHCLARQSVALSRVVIPQCSSCHMCRGSIRGNDVEGCWGSLLVATRQGWARSSAQAARRPAVQPRPELGHGRGTRDEQVTRQRPLLSGEGPGEHISMSSSQGGAAGTGPAGCSSQRGGSSPGRQGTGAEGKCERGRPSRRRRPRSHDFEL